MLGWFHGENLSAQNAVQQLKIVLKYSTIHNIRSDACNSNVIATALSKPSPSKGSVGGICGVIGMPSGVPSMILKETE